MAGPFDPGEQQKLITIVTLSFVSGLVSFLGRHKERRLSWQLLLALLSDCAAAMLVGCVVYWICRRANLDEWGTVVVVSISSHMGARLLTYLESLALKWLRKYDAN